LTDTSPFRLTKKGTQINDGYFAEKVIHVALILKVNAKFREN
jgi:hypothetical protein